MSDELISRDDIVGLLGERVNDDELAERSVAAIERAAAEKAWDRCVGEMPIDPDWKNFYGDNNPYRAEAYRREGKE